VKWEGESGEFSVTRTPQALRRATRHQQARTAPGARHAQGFSAPGAGAFQCERFCAARTRHAKV